MKKARLGALGAVLLVSAATVGTASVAFAQSPDAGSVPPGPGAPEKTALRIVQGSDPDFTQVALTKAIQTLNEQGITTEFANVGDTDTATRAAIAGQADIVVNSLYYGINANQQGIPLRTFLADVQAVDYLLVSIPSVTDLKMLEGGTMGINKPGDLGAVVADQCLKFAGIDVSQVEEVQVGGTSARMAALLAGQIMAAPAHAAEALNAQKEGGLNILADCGQVIGTFLQTGANATQEWLDANPNLAQIVTDAYIDALRWAATDKAGYIELSKVVAPELDDAIRDQTYDLLMSQNVFGVDGGLTAEAVQKLVDIGLDSESIAEPVPTDWYTMQYVDSYLARHGAFGQ